MSLLENMYLAEHTLSAGKFAISKRGERNKFEKYRKMLNIKAQDSNDSILSLSGGNQQKVFLARWLNTDADILLLDNPTQGIDVGAKAEIENLIQQLSAEGVAVIYISSEWEELERGCDRIIVLNDGMDVEELVGAEISEERLLKAMTTSRAEKCKEKEAVS